MVFLSQGFGAVFSIGCRMYRHPVEIVTQTVKWPVLVVQALWGKSLGNPCFFAIFVFLNHNKDDMKGKHCIFLLLILAALISCNDPKPVTETLHRAEALMNEYPDSVWTLLNTISSDDMEQL